MNLPVVETPVFNFTMPSSGKDYKCRPFILKEEKTLLIAKESKDKKTILDAVTQILSACTFNEIDVQTLNPVDFEMLFIAIKSQSTGEEVELNYRCKSEKDDKKCNHVSSIVVNLSDIEVKGTFEEGKINITDNIGIKFKYPTIKMTKEVLDKEDSTVVIAKCVEYIWDETNVYQSADITLKDKVKWIDELASTQLKDVKKFFSGMPKTILETDFVCSKCGYKEKLKLSGLDDFFG